MSLEIHVVLVRPEQPRNVGSVVRAAANFGAASVRLVLPHGWDAESFRLARVASSGAWQVVTPVEYRDVAAATTGCDILAATSARHRAVSIDPVTPEVFFRRVIDQSLKVGLVFGPEGQGLSVEEFAACHEWLRIGTDPRFPSLNLSHSVALLLYEAFRWQKSSRADDAQALRKPAQSHEPATVSAQEACLLLWKDLLEEAGVLGPATRVHQSGQLRRLLHRAQPTGKDLELLEQLCHKLRKTMH